MASSLLLGKLLAIAALLLFSVNILVTKAATSRLSLNLGFMISVTVNLLFCISLFGIEFLFRTQELHWNSYGFMLFLLAGVFSTYFGRWFFFEGIIRFGPTKASIFQVSSPGFVAIIAWVVLHESLSNLALAGMALAVSGLLLVAYVPGTIFRQRSTDAAGPASRTTLAASIVQSGLLLGLGSSASYAVGTVLRGAAIRSWHEPILGALLGAASGPILHTVFNLNMRNLHSDIKAADRTGIALYGASGILTILGQIFSIASLRYIPASLSNLITLSTPVLVIPASYFLLKNREGITLKTWIGGALAMIGIGVIVMNK
jgi:drug/metabolite transporter (DMT)-like permease